ncbi:MAG: NAD(P)/FAD-dependent oxidoreductase [candidate division WOR-3 bacterium]|nr:NAD(P)/FAD-dependent oxidoreductase [candidate division WOR-3 bacterium]
MSKKFDAQYDICIVGAGPAGLSAAQVAAELGAKVVLIDDNPVVGGQLIKQTHKFFGSKSHYCGVRGIDIARILSEKIKHPNINLMLNSSVIGYYQDNIFGVVQLDRFLKIIAPKIIIAPGAAENLIAFPNNDLPGVYGAGAVQTLMNVHGILPGKRALMVGSGNIGLIVSYQMMQAGIEVVAVIEIMDKIGGYHVHAAKLRRLGVPILTSHTIKYAIGKDCVNGAVIVKVNKKLKPIKNTEKTLKVDMICLAVGLTPLSELLYQAGCQINYVPELGGNVAWHNEDMETSKPGIYVAGDVSGIEEASTAMLEGRIAGANAYQSLFGQNETAQKIVEQAKKELQEIRQGPFGFRPKVGKEKLKTTFQQPSVG